MQVAIVKYNAGNIRSVQFALQRVGVVDVLITDDPLRLRHADRVIFPGVGHAGSAMQYLHTHGLDQVIPQLTQPVLGICLGLQLLCAHSTEGDTACLDVFPEHVDLFPSSVGKVPHVGWNSIQHLRTALFDGVQDGAHVYAVHSYYAAIGADTVAETEYGVPFSAALHRNNFFAVQFHPEKSGAVGERILHNFLYQV
jgi:glutamine amidotransferase